MNAMTMADVSCPRCHARPGEACKTPRGSVTYREHAVRTEAARRAQLVRVK